jgi:lipid-A-disaccharide synthase
MKKISPFLMGEIFSTTPNIKNAKCILDISRFSVVGIPSTKNLISTVFYLLKSIKFVVENNINLLILCDAPDFNIPLGAISKALLHQKIKVIYFIPPTIWAWRENRKELVKSFSDRVLCILPFEKDVWGEKSIFVGHPLCKIIKEEGFTERSKIKKKKNQKSEFVAILPGSRASEIKNHIDIFLSLLDMFKDEKIIVPTKFPDILWKEIEKASEKETREKIKEIVKIVPSENSRWAMSNSKVVILASGTASLESALLGKPAVIFYKLSKFSFEIAKRIVKVKFISLPNIIMGRMVYPELIQYDAQPEKIYTEAKRISDEDFSWLSEELFSKLDGLDFVEIAEIMQNI